MKQVTTKNLSVANCTNCRWAACRHYGYDRNACEKYIPDLKLEKGYAK